MTGIAIRDTRVSNVQALRLQELHSDFLFVKESRIFGDLDYDLQMKLRSVKAP